MQQVYYKSTRGGEDNMLSSEAILKGIAEDGGLFVPGQIPHIGDKLESLLNMDYKQLAYEIMRRFFTDFEEHELKECIEKAYGRKFDTPEIAPLKKIGDVFLLELFHGPTLAFKDMALSILPHLLKTAAKKQNVHKEIVILTATSGDTGGAALEGFSDVEGTKIIVFFPEDGVSPIQKRQMTGHNGKNSFVIGVNGNFDDTQNGVKSIFADREFEKLLDKNNYIFSSANSINIGRLIPQVVYYFYAYINMCKSDEIKMGEKINVVVPTGNFGNILAAYFAKEMGLPINKFICASNDNKVLYDFLNTGVYDKSRKFVTTISPSMDILISSNLERLLYLVSDEDSNKVKELMKGLGEKGVYEITQRMKGRLGDLYGGFATEGETRETIKDVYEAYGYIMDTHTAVAYDVYNKYLEKIGDLTKSVITSTASPFKFTGAVMTSIDEKYGDYSDFQLIKEMSKIGDCKAPSVIEDIESNLAIHQTVCEKDEMKSIVTRILNL